MLKIGKTNALTITNLSDKFIYFHTPSEPELSIERNSELVDKRIGDELVVFIYTDGQGELKATTQTPLAQVDEVAWLQVVYVSKVGAFLNWGLEKDLFVPFSEQKNKMIEGHSYLVRVFLDEDNRIAASALLDDFVADEAVYLKEGQKVELIIADETELGFKAVVNHQFWGVLYKNETYQPLSRGQKTDGFVKKIRDDKRLDVCLSLQKNTEKAEDLSRAILQYLNQHEGQMPITDKSSPEIIKDTFGVSKKIFKQALGSLYKQRLIVLNPESTHLTKKQ